MRLHRYCFFFLNDTATTETYTLPLHDALPICLPPHPARAAAVRAPRRRRGSGGGLRRRRRGLARRRPSLERGGVAPPADRKSTRLNSSHANISYAVFCLKKKKYMSQLPTLRDR